MVYSDNDRKSDFNFFLKNYHDLFKKYGHKFVVIQHETVLGVYNTVREAIDKTCTTIPLGGFIVQECNGNESGYTNYIMSWELV